jgi:hypothetical protein
VHQYSFEIPWKSLKNDTESTGKMSTHISSLVLHVVIPYFEVELHKHVYFLHK